MSKKFDVRSTRGSHDPCGQRWRNYSVSYTKDRERNFVSEPIGAKLAWTLKVISLSGLKRRVRRKSRAPLINAAGRAVHTKPSSSVAPVFIRPAQNSLSRGFCGRKQNRRHSRAHRPHALLLYREIGLLKRYYESVEPRTIPWKLESSLMIQVRRFPPRPKSNWTRTSIQVFILTPL